MVREPSYHPSTYSFWAFKPAYKKAFRPVSGSIWQSSSVRCLFIHSLFIRCLFIRCRWRLLRFLLESFHGLMNVIGSGILLELCEIVFYKRLYAGSSGGSDQYLWNQTGTDLTVTFKVREDLLEYFQFPFVRAKNPVHLYRLIIHPKCLKDPTSNSKNTWFLLLLMLHNRKIGLRF